MKTAQYWHKTEEGAVKCDLCPHGCVLKEGKTGLCRVRGNVNGTLQALGYGHLSSAHLDPIEKKPLHHFRPGSQIFSVGGWGCNLACIFCQNWTISQRFVPDDMLHTPEEIATAAGKHGSIGIAYTYNEPLIAFEFVKDCAVLVHQRGLVNVLVTNGYIRLEPATELLPLIDALNVDIKSMDEEFYREQCRASLQPILEFTKLAVKLGCHVEVTNLVIPDLNDSEDHFRRLAQWMRENLGEKVPLHFSAYFPQYKMQRPPTPISTLERAYEIAQQYLLYVFLGNVAGTVGQDTLCPGCKTVLVTRTGYRVALKNIANRTCAKCGRAVDLVL